MDSEVSAHKVLEENKVYRSETGLEVIHSTLLEIMLLNSYCIRNFNKAEFIQVIEYFL